MCPSSTNPKIFSVIFVIVTTMLFFSEISFSDHPNDSVGPYASGFSFQTTKIISGGIIGRNIEVTATGSTAVLDRDCHYVDANTSILQNDVMLYSWSISSTLYDTPPPDFNVNPISFTTKDGTGSGSIIMRVKDQGAHYQDKSGYENVASLNVTIVDPNGIDYDVVVQSPYYVTKTGRDAEFNLDASLENIVLTYNGVLLPWTGSIKESLAGDAVWTPPSPYYTSDPVNWERAAGYPAQVVRASPLWNISEGVFDKHDPKNTYYAGNAPPGYAYIFVTKQAFVNANASDVQFTPIYDSRKWMHTYSSSSTGRLPIPGTAPTEYVELHYTHQ